MAWQQCKKFGLTDRQVHVAEFVARGYSIRRIAQELSITPLTVKGHMRGIVSRLGIARDKGMVSRVQVVDRLRAMGLGRNAI